MSDSNNENEVQNLRRELLNLKPDDDNARMDLNKRLIERYPFLEIRGWDESKPGDFCSTWLDQMPMGWKKTLGIQLCEELREELLRIDPALLNTYKVSQVKEKYGTLRWYGVGYSDRMDDIITKYNDFSKYTCIICGKINVPIFDDGWISPFCIECYKKHREKVWGNKVTDEKAKSFIVGSPGLTRDTIVEIHSLKGVEQRKIDFSDTLRTLGVNPDNLPTIDDVIGMKLMGSRE